MLTLLLLSCSNTSKKEFKVLTEKEKYEFINNIYRNNLGNGTVFLYDLPYIASFSEDSIFEINNIVFRNNEKYLNNCEAWKREYLDENFYLIKSFDSYDSDLLFENRILLSISQPLIDVTGKYILIVEKKYVKGVPIDGNTYIYTKNDKNEWIVYYTLNIGKGLD
jgi:hypothetical protein